MEKKELAKKIKSLLVENGIDVPVTTERFFIHCRCYLNQEKRNKIVDVLSKHFEIKQRVDIANDYIIENQTICLL